MRLKKIWRLVAVYKKLVATLMCKGNCDWNDLIPWHCAIAHRPSSQRSIEHYMSGQGSSAQIVWEREKTEEGEGGTWEEKEIVSDWSK